LASPGGSQWQRLAQQAQLQQERKQTAQVVTAAPLAARTGVACSEAAQQTVATQAEALASGESSIEKVRRNGMIFEVGLTFTFLHYQSIFIFFARGLFQSVRPLLILFVFGQILKAVFFVAGAPIWCSFYSIWMFEVIYGLAQCAISFIFICSFYNNLSFARIRPALTQLFRQEREKLARAARALAC